MGVVFCRLGTHAEPDLRSVIYAFMRYCDDLRGESSQRRRNESLDS
jgi:hypothetical protein